MIFSIISIENIPIQDLIILAESYLGKGYLNKDYFEEAIQSNKYDGRAVLNKSNQLIAFLIVYKTSDKEVLDNANEASLKLMLDKSIICIDTIVVHLDYRKQGIGDLLVNTVIQKYKNKYGFIIYAWSTRGVISMNSIATKNNFKRLIEILDLWRYDCEKNLFICPAKEKSVICRCSAILYYLKQTK